MVWEIGQGKGWECFTGGGRFLGWLIWFSWLVSFVCCWVEGGNCNRVVGTVHADLVC